MTYKVKLLFFCTPVGLIQVWITLLLLLTVLFPGSPGISQQLFCISVQLLSLALQYCQGCIQLV